MPTIGSMEVCARCHRARATQKDGHRDIGGNLFCGEQDAHGDRQVVGRSLLREVRRREVDGDAAYGKCGARVLNLQSGRAPWPPARWRLLDRRWSSLGQNAYRLSFYHHGEHGETVPQPRKRAA